MSQQPTLRDVAKLAGVHPSTASRVLSGSRTVGPDLALAVQRAAQTLDYRVNVIGRALRQRKTGTIGMVVPAIDNPFFPAMVKAVEKSLHEHEFELFICDAANDPVLERERLRNLVARRVDGILISPVHQHDSADAVRSAAAQVAVVQLDRSVSAGTDRVEVDQEALITDLVTHLRDNGRRRLAFLTSGGLISTIQERLTVYRRLVADDADSLRRVYRGDLTVEWGIRATEQILTQESALPDAFVCANDLIALGAMQRLRVAGIRVPDDIAVTGIDDLAFGQVAHPALTTARQPVDQMGQEAVAMLLRRLAEPDLAPRRLVLGSHLIIRASSAVRGHDA